MKNLVKRLWKDEAGQDLVEYGLLLTLIALVAVVSMKAIGSTIANVFSTAATNLSTNS
jgi:pilus assembly protein Flp/PilA